jgi:serine phosphatase RsbU (regulator of sigma subunit)
MAESWQELAAAASQEKDSEKLRLLVNKLIQALGQEQKHVRDEIQTRIKRHVRDMEKQGLDPSIP